MDMDNNVVKARVGGGWSGAGWREAKEEKWGKSVIASTIKTGEEDKFFVMCISSNFLKYIFY